MPFSTYTFIHSSSCVIPTGLYFISCSFVGIMYVCSCLSTREHSVKVTAWQHNGWTADDIPNLRFIMLRLNTDTRNAQSDILTQRTN